MRAVYLEWVVALGFFIVRTLSAVLSMKRPRRNKVNTIRRVSIPCFFLNWWGLVVFKLFQFDTTWFGVSPFFTIAFMNGFVMMEVDVLDRVARFTIFLRSQAAFKVIEGREREEIERGYRFAMIATILGYNSLLIPAMVVGSFDIVVWSMQLSSFSTILNVTHTQHVIRKILKSLQEGRLENEKLQGTNSVVMNARIDILLRKSSGLLRSSLLLAIFFVLARTIFFFPNVVQFSCYILPLSLSLQLFIHTYMSLGALRGRRRMELRSSRQVEPANTATVDTNRNALSHGRLFSGKQMGHSSSVEHESISSAAQFAQGRS